jgi:DNA-directed RNA polymerase specialized sigma24 family protein
MREIAPFQLAARCRSTQQDGSHEPFCLELFHRAIAEGCSLCWHYLHNQYYSLVRYWVSLRAPPDPDTVDDLTQEAFTTFWRFYTPAKLACADGLGDILSYLKSCAASVVAQAHRKADKGVPEVEWDESVVDACVSTYSAEASAFQHVAAEHLWAAVEACCSDDRERLLARLTLVAGLRPRHIVEQFPELFSDVSEVYRIKRNLVDRLRRDPNIEGMRENGWNERLMK